MPQDDNQGINEAPYSFKDIILRLERESQATVEFRGRVTGDMKAMRDDIDMLQRLLIEGDRGIVSIVARLDERITACTSKHPDNSLAPRPSIVALENQAKITIASITAIASTLAIALPLLITNTRDGIDTNGVKGLKQITPPPVEQKKN